MHCTARCPALHSATSQRQTSASSIVQALVAHHQQLEIWKANCPDNFENRAALVGAEIARIEGREHDAMHLYEQAIRSARANGFFTTRRSLTNWPPASTRRAASRRLPV